MEMLLVFIDIPSLYYIRDVFLFFPILLNIFFNRLYSGERLAVFLIFKHLILFKIFATRKHINLLYINSVPKQMYIVEQLNDAQSHLIQLPL